MGGALAWVTSTVGKKVQMAVSGFLMFAFVFVHMAGNLKAFQGAEKFNTYAEYIRELGSPILPHSGFLWVQRVVLLVVVILHGALAYDLARRGRRARPMKYKQNPDLGFSYASRTMRWGGVIIAVFIVYHLLHLTVGLAHSAFIPNDPYHNLVVGLSNPLVALTYVGAVSALTIHLYHGLWSGVRTLGFGRGFDVVRRPFVVLLTGLLWLGYIVVPFAVQVGVLEP